jgi:hypothetical protein
MPPETVAQDENDKAGAQRPRTRQDEEMEMEIGIYRGLITSNYQRV